MSFYHVGYRMLLSMARYLESEKWRELCMKLGFEAMMTQREYVPVVLVMDILLPSCRI